MRGSTRAARLVGTYAAVRAAPMTITDTTATTSGSRALISNRSGATLRVPSAGCRAPSRSRRARTARGACDASERFLQGEVEAARPALAPAPVGRQGRARTLVQQDAEAESRTGRIGVEQLRAGFRAADRRRVQERDDADEPV